MLSEMPPRVSTPARRQIEQTRKLQAAETTASDYNIWYGNSASERHLGRAMRAATRVVLSTDAGLTRADHTNASAPLCLHFARGACIHGKDCTYRHVAPAAVDETMAGAPSDVFGRTRHASFRDDMGGTGNWNRDCKTLYVGRVCSIPPDEEIHATLVRHFGEFGQIESVRVQRDLGCAFVTYAYRCTAEFAKEAMAEQSLDHDEQINVRWARDDPNPRAETAKLRNNARTMLAAMEKRGVLQELAEPHTEPHTEPPRDADEPAAKRQALVVPPALADPLRPMGRQDHERLESERQAAAAAAEAEAARQTEVDATASAASRLDAVLSKIGSGDAAVGDEETVAAAAGSAGVDTETERLCRFLSSVAGTPERRESADAESVCDDPPGIVNRRLPPGWREYLEYASGRLYYVHDTCERRTSTYWP